jgi:drug/metabolite transporter (DMT)-like permease
MTRLLLASLIWAFSFGLIKKHLGSLHPQFVAAARLLLSALVFLPFARIPRTETRRIDVPLLLQLFTVGVLEFGLMYVCYLSAFRTLQAWQVALFTSFTPVAVLLIASIYRKDWKNSRIWPVFFATLAASALTLRAFPETPALTGILLVQASNLLFSWGQIHHARVMSRMPVGLSTVSVLFWEYLGGALAVALFLLFTPEALSSTWEKWPSLPLETLATLLYSGLIASGLGFFLWNSGVSQVPPATLSVLNNLKAPLAALVSVFFFHETASLEQLALSLLLFLLAWGVAFWLEKGNESLLSGENPRAPSGSNAAKTNAAKTQEPG